MSYAHDFSIDDLDLTYCNDSLETARESLTARQFEIYSGGMKGIMKVAANDGYGEGISLADLIATSYPGEVSMKKFDLKVYDVLGLTEIMNIGDDALGPLLHIRGWRMCHDVYFKGFNQGLDSIEMDTEEKVKKLQEIKKEVEQILSYGR